MKDMENRWKLKDTTIAGTFSLGMDKIGQEFKKLGESSK
jgi:hypothetical protein